MSRAISILICALGGEGGGVLASWLSSAATAAGLPVQRTSIPGVAQRTGATTYYLEIFPTPRHQLGGLQPVLGLHPAEAGVDLIVATELLEASRALHRGFAAKDRTLLLTSTHRVYTIGEKSAAVHGRFNERNAYEAIAALVDEAVQFDGQAVAKSARSQLNAVLFGAIAGSGRLPITKQTFEAAIRGEGKSVDENLRGFEAGWEKARDARRSRADVSQLRPVQGARDPSWMSSIRAAFPLSVWPIVHEGIQRLTDYQDVEYARLYVDRLRTLQVESAGGSELLRETARHLALWMSYEDVIRVAQLKTRPSRLQRIRSSHAAGWDQPLQIVDYLKPGPTEVCSLLPPGLGRRVKSYVVSRNLEQRLSISMQVKTSSVLGFAKLRLLALLRRWRRHSFGFQEEQRLINAWLQRVLLAARCDLRLAAQIAECAELVRGYAETRQRGYLRLQRINDVLIDPILGGRKQCADAAEVLRRARIAAASDDSGAALEKELAAYL